MAIIALHHHHLTFDGNVSVILNYIIYMWFLREGVIISFLRLIKFMHVQEEIGIRADGSEESVSNLGPNSSFGEISILCNIPQHYTVRVCKLCRLLRVDKQSFSNILEIYFHDGRIILNNLLEVI